MSSRGKRRFDTIAEIDADHLFRAPFGGELRMSAFAAAAFEHDLVFEKVGCHGLEPAEKLFVVFRIVLREMGPLPAEILRRLGLVLLDLAEIRKTRHAANDLVFARALLDMSARLR